MVLQRVRHDWVTELNWAELNICCKVSLVVLNSLNLACRKSFWLLHQFWMRSFPDRVILVIDFSVSALHIYLAVPFWPAEFLLKDQLLDIWGLSCTLLVLFPCCFYILYLCLISVSLISMYFVVCFSLGLSCMGLFAPLGLDWHFPFPCLGNFQL